MSDPPFVPSVLVALPDVIAPVTHLRGTALVSSLHVLREMGLQDGVFAALRPELHEPVENVLAASWVEVALATEYYRAVDSLGLTEDQIVSIGKLAAERVQSAVVGTIMRGLRGIVTPATILARMDLLWSRNTKGGAVKVEHTARREIRVEAHGTPYLDFRYCRTALMGYYHQALAPSAKTLTIREMTQPGSAAAAWLVAWN